MCKNTSTNQNTTTKRRYIRPGHNIPPPPPALGTCGKRAPLRLPFCLASSLPGWCQVSLQRGGDGWRRVRVIHPTALFQWYYERSAMRLRKAQDATRVARWLPDALLKPARIAGSVDCRRQKTLRRRNAGTGRLLRRRNRSSVARS